MRVNALKRVLGDTTAHVDACLGTDQQCHDYCSKDETRVQGPWEFGVLTHQGHRSDLEAMTQLVKDGVQDHEIAEQFPTGFVKFAPGLRRLRNALFPPSWRDSIVTNVYVGPTRIGKTYFVYKHYGVENVYRVTYSKDRVWFDGYHGQDILFFDEFTGLLFLFVFTIASGMDQVDIANLLKWLDPYPTMMDIKGDFTSARWTKVIICTNNPVNTWYQSGWKTISPEQVEALQARLTNIYDVTSRDEIWKTVGLTPSGVAINTSPPTSPTLQQSASPQSPQQQNPFLHVPAPIPLVRTSGLRRSPSLTHSPPLGSQANPLCFDD